MESSLKGVILAGGTGSRLHPLTQITNKHLLPVYDRPMINWAIEALIKAGVTPLGIVTLFAPPGRPLPPPLRQPAQFRCPALHALPVPAPPPAVCPRAPD